LRSTAADRTVVLCGGLGCTRLVWDAQLPALGGWNVVCVDHPGHGDAPRAEFESLADLEFWLDRARTVRREGLGAIAGVVLQRWFTPGFSNVQPFRSMLLATDTEGYARCCEAVAHWDARDELNGISAPTLVVAGAADPSTPPSHGELLADRIPHARLAVIPRAAHLANVERPNEFNELLRRHL
jgi:pimeloyl-ACP methyl ester carboxylesterase